MSGEPVQPDSGALVETVRAGIGIVGNNVTAWAALDALAARLAGAEAEQERLRVELDEKRSAIRYKHEDLEAAERQVAALEAALRDVRRDVHLVVATGLESSRAHGAWQAIRRIDTALDSLAAQGSGGDAGRAG